MIAQLRPVTTVLATCVALAACHGRDAEAPRTTGAPSDAGPSASASTSLSASSRAAAAPSICPPLPAAAERQTRGPCVSGSDCALAFVGCCIGGEHAAK